MRLVKELAPRWLRIGGYWYPRGGMPIDVFWQTGPPPQGLWLPDPGVARLSRPGYRGAMSRPPPEPKRPPRPASPAELRDAIRDEALRLGFDAVGFAPASLAPEARRERLQRLDEFVEAGWQGDMGWLGERTEERADPQRLWRDARTVVSLALNYAPASDPLAVLKERERAAISVYAQGRDYHEVMKTKLKALGRFIWDTYRHDLKVFVDTAPLMEKPAAQAAAMAGRASTPTSCRASSAPGCSWARSCCRPNCRPIRPRPTIAANATPASTSARPRPFPRPTGSRRGAASPTSPSSMKGRSTGAPSAARQPHLRLRRLPGGLPVEQVRQASARGGLHAAAGTRRAVLAELAALDDAAFRKRFAGTAVKRIGRDRFLRNVAYALGNSGRPRDRPAGRRGAVEQTPRRWCAMPPHGHCHAWRLISRATAERSGERATPTSAPNGWMPANSAGAKMAAELSLAP